jgi:hypothetical protein
LQVNYLSHSTPGSSPPGTSSEAANKRNVNTPTDELKDPIRLAYQPPASSAFLSEQISHQQPASSTFLSEQISTSHQPPAKRTG